MAKRKKQNKRTNSELQNTTQKTKDRATRTPLKIVGELRCSGRVNKCNLIFSKMADSITHVQIKPWRKTVFLPFKASGITLWYLLVFPFDIFWYFTLISSGITLCYLLVLPFGIFWYYPLVSSGITLWYLLVLHFGIFWYYPLESSDITLWYLLVLPFGIFWCYPLLSSIFLESCVFSPSIWNLSFKPALSERLPIMYNDCRWRQLWK